MKTKTLLLKCLALLFLATYSCTTEQEIDSAETNQNQITTKNLYQEQQASSSSCQNSFYPVIEDVDGNSLSVIKTGNPLFYWVNATLCNSSSPKMNLYLEKVTSNGSVSISTVATNVSIPRIPQNRIQVIIPNNIESGEYILKMVTQLDIPNGIFNSEVIYSSSFTVFNMSTSIVPNGNFDSNASWTLSSGGSVANSKLITPDMCSVNMFCITLFTVTSSYFTVSSGTKYLILSNGLHGGKFQLINSSNQLVFTYTNNGSYGSGDQMKSFNLPSTGSYKIKFTYYGDNFGDSPEEAQGTVLDYVILN